MDFALSEILTYAAALTAPVTAYTGWVHRELSKTHKRIDARVKKEDYREDMADIKEMMREMRQDIKAILGVPQ